MSPVDAEVGGVTRGVGLRASISSGRQGAFSEWAGYVTPTDFQPVENDFQVFNGEQVMVYGQKGNSTVKGSTDTISGRALGGSVLDSDFVEHKLKPGEVWVNPNTRVKYVGR